MKGGASFLSTHSSDKCPRHHVFCWETVIQVTLTDSKGTNWCVAKFPEGRRCIFGVLSRGLMFTELLLFYYVDWWESGCVHTEYIRRLENNSEELVLSTNSGMELKSLSLVPSMLSHITGPYCVISKKKNSNSLRFTMGHVNSTFYPPFALDSSEKITCPVSAQTWHFLFLKSLSSLTISFITQILDQKKDSDT